LAEVVHAEAGEDFGAHAGGGLLAEVVEFLDLFVEHPIHEGAGPLAEVGSEAEAGVFEGRQHGAGQPGIVFLDQSHGEDAESAGVVTADFMDQHGGECVVDFDGAGGQGAGGEVTGGAFKAAGNFGAFTGFRVGGQGGIAVGFQVDLAAADFGEKIDRHLGGFDGPGQGGHCQCE